MRFEERNGRRYAVLTKIIRVPVDVIEDIRPSPSGRGAVLVTDRGSTMVAEDCADLVKEVYGFLPGVTNGR